MFSNYSYENVQHSRLDVSFLRSHSKIFFLLLDFSGSLSTLRKLDRETSAQFSLQITAEDGGGKVSNDRWITQRLFKDEMLKVRGVSPPFELHF